MDLQGAKGRILVKLRDELPPERTYHSLWHTLDVYASAIDIAEQENVTGDDLVLLKTAALFHDSGFTEQDHDHEEAGCRIARVMLPDHGYGKDQIERICAMILATKVPQTPRDRLSEILCDADLDYLGRSDFWSVGRTLFNEMRAFGTLRTEQEWNQLQERFLERHHYFTASTRRARERDKQKHLDEVRAWLKENP
ncbi:MAG: HD domain-containing protein [Flavobacteriales bacterium]|nr:HD domain-containing protein [Flavobacteriales bacterium]MCB9193390.1 HD domain-containing protein [Flavobacteriales bacterium]